jgi:hypothetical protein
MKTSWMMKKCVMGAALLLMLPAAAHAQGIELFGHGTEQASPPECQEYSCGCISTNVIMHDGFGGQNLGIKIKRIDPRVRRITLSATPKGRPYYNRMPAGGEVIPIRGTRVYAKAFPDNLGLGCAVHFWTVDHNHNPRFPKRNP